MQNPPMSTFQIGDRVTYLGFTGTIRSERITGRQRTFEFFSYLVEFDPVNNQAIQVLNKDLNYATTMIGINENRLVAVANNTAAPASYA